MIQTWSGRSGRQQFVYAVTQNGSYTFNWAFQKQTWSQELPYNGLRMRILDADVARIYSINVTNTMEGGASECLPCAQVQIDAPSGTQSPATSPIRFIQGSDASGCIPCPPGHFTDNRANGSQCQKCPPNSVVTDPVAVGSSSCITCGPGLISTNGKVCSTDCQPTVNGTRYDLRKIGR